MDADHTPADDPSALTALETEMLAFEAHWWKYAGAKESDIRARFDMSTTRYYQVLNALIDKPAAHAAAPVLVSRLIRLRAERRRQRSAKRLQDGLGQPARRQSPQPCTDTE